MENTAFRSQSALWFFSPCQMQTTIIGSSKTEPQTFANQTETPVFTGVLQTRPSRQSGTCKQNAG
jgi:hypothetical protein